jgi:hypothetical protein
MTTVSSLSGAFSTLSKSSSYVARIAGSTWALQSGKFPLVSFSLIGTRRREGMIVVVDGAGDDEVIMDLSIEKNLEIGCLRS